MPYLFTSESVSEGHPDKVADQISDAVLDAFLKLDPHAKVACETLVTTGLAVIAGEVKIAPHHLGHIDIDHIARETIKHIGYDCSEYKFDADSCAVIRTLHGQSPDINRGVERKRDEEQGAGDQGMMFGYACRETDNYMPLSLELAHLLLRELSLMRREGKVMKYLRPDAKSQVTIEYGDDKKPKRVETIVVSTQHDEFGSDAAMQKKIREDVLKYLMPRVLNKLPKRIQVLFDNKIKYFVNPTGKFVIGGPHGDTGLTGRKIIVDTYGGRGAHGGGAFSGKDASKVDRSAAYATRHIAKNLVAAGVCDEVLVQVAYAIGVAKPMGIYVNSYATAKVKGKNGKIMSDGEIAQAVSDIFDMRPYAIINRLGLRNPIFSETAAYGHMGRKPEIKTVNGKKYETFTWEKLDYVSKVKKAFGLG